MMHRIRQLRLRGVVLLALFCLLLSACARGTSSSGHALVVTGNTPGATPSGGGASSSHSAVESRARAEQRLSTSANWYLSRMSLDEKLGQMFLIETGWQNYNGDTDNMVAGMHAGAMIIYQQNMATYGQLQSYIAAIQAHAKIPLLMSMDEEGGVVDRLGYLGFEPPLPAAQDLAASGNPNNATRAGAAAAKEMIALGINTDLAPVADVRTNPYAVEYTRIFGDDPQTVTTYAGAFLQGLQSNGVIGCVKHWPGLGDVALDPHETLPTNDRTLAQLQSVDFAPFKALLPLNPGMIMVTHIIVSAIDPTMPATLSPKLVDGVLRGQLGYQGVVMTDSLYMKGISDRYSLPEAGVLAVIAGDDLLEGAYDTTSMSAMIAALKQAISSGRITIDRINQSVRRILMLKIRYGMLPLRQVPGSPQLASIPGAASAPSAIADADVPKWVA
ncbi:MAG: Beta-hexosaminidase [Ktedonobacterales bacterium]|jgi:beta-N-acetylhexosaminidase|nr:MAG: Beta-hexosaminidase [Ktedonobacterales bacterium]